MLRDPPATVGCNPSANADRPAVTSGPASSLRGQIQRQPPTHKRKLNHTPIYLRREDNSKLRRLLATSGYFTGNNALRKLREELDRAAILDSHFMPPHVVTMESTVEFEDLSTHEIQEYTLVFPGRANIDDKLLSVLAPIGTALLGCRVGNVVRWSTPGGVRHLLIRRVTQPDCPSATVAAVPEDDLVGVR